MLSGLSWQKKLLLWLAALAVLCFVAAQFPDLRRRLPWIAPPRPASPLG